MIVVTVPSPAVPGAVDALRGSLVAQHPGARLLVADPWPGDRAGDLDIGAVVGRDTLARLRVALAPDDLEAVLAPAVLLAAIEHTGEPAVYLRSTSAVTGSLEPLLAAASACAGGLAVVPTSVEVPPRDGRWPGPDDTAALGSVDRGVVAAAPTARDALARWAAGLDRGPLPSPLAAWALAGRAACLPPGSAIGWWNLHEHRLQLDGGRLLLDGGTAVAVVRLDGADPTLPMLLRPGVDAPRHLLSCDPALAVIVQRWAVASGAGLARDTSLVPGFDPPAWLRAGYRCAWEAAAADGSALPPAPTDGDGLARLLDWLGRPDPVGSAPLPRWQEWIWNERADLRAAFPEVMSGVRAGFAEWVRVNGRSEMSVPAVLTLVEPDPLPSDAPPAPVAGTDVIGYFGAVLGNGTSADLVRTALREVGEPVRAVTTARTTSATVTERVTGSTPQHDIAVAVVTPHQFSPLRSDLGLEYFGAHHMIGYWFWEAEVLPEEYRPALDLVDEIWVATQFGRLAFERLTDKPLNVLPHPLLPPAGDGPTDLASFGLPDRFTFLFTFDAFSNVTRKNPEAVVEAYTRAFGPDDGAQLVVKSLNGDRRAAALEPLRFLAAHRPDVHLLDGTWPPGRLAALMAASGCYVSLHRSEGLGMTMAEAMWLGKPVVATAYSGNMDFMDEDTAFLVPFDRVAIPEGCEPYPAGTPWAEPDLDRAAELLRRVFEDPAEAGRRAARGRERLAADFSAHRCGLRMQARMREIRAGR